MRFERESESFVVDGRVSYRGIKRPLKAVCFPDYDYKQAKRACRGATKRSTGLRRPWHGRSRGTCVHEQVRVLVQNDFRLDSLSVAFGPGTRLHPHTRRFFAALGEKRLIPVASEFADFYERYQLASSIDLICISEKTGLVCLVELKTGGENYFRHGNAPLRNPPGLSENNSPLNQAFLQLSVYCQMLHDHYPELALGSHYVAQVCNDEVVFYRLPERFESSARPLVDLIGVYKRK